jgi:hypothetical protein
MTWVASASGASRPCRTRSSIAARKAASVLPDPVGAAMRVWRPALIAGHASACAGVGEAKLSANQLTTAGWNRVSTPVDVRGAAELSPAAVRAFEIEAKSECKRLGPSRTWVNCDRLYMAPDRDLVTLAPEGAIADRAFRCSLAEYCGLPQISRLVRWQPQTPAVRQQYAPPNWENIYDQ